MSDIITIKKKDILKCEDNSIYDPETIRQIALYSIKYNDNSLFCKVKSEFEVFGLYPQTMKKIDILPDKLK